MKRFVLFLLVVFLFGIPGLMVQADAKVDSTQDSGTTANAASEATSDDELEQEDGTVLSRMKTRMSFTRRELNKISDPRIRDLYWYALNDTTDRKRYLRAHYAFNEWKDNWSFIMMGGVQGVGMSNVKERFSLGPQIDIGFKKDLHPYWAVRAIGYFSHYNHKLYTAHESTMTSDWTGYPATPLTDWWMPIEYTTIGINGTVMLNLMNLFAGREMIYTPFVANAYAGAGFAFSCKEFGQRDGSCIVPQWLIGAEGGWNFNQRYSLLLDAYLSWQGDDLEGFSTQNSTWKYGVSLGISYKFSKVIHFKRLGYDEDFGRRQILDVDSDDDGDDLQTIIEDGSRRNNGPTVVRNMSADMIEAAFFQIDRIELQHTYVLNLGFYANMIKAHPDQKFLVKGFADIEVGSLKRNLWLSEQRAKVVADVLVKTYGVNADQLIVGGGDLDYDIPFLRQHGHHRFNRCTIVCPLDEDYQIIKEDTFDDKSELMDGRVAPPAKNY